MRIDEVIGVMEGITYKPGWQIDVNRINGRDGYLLFSNPQIEVRLTWMAPDATRKQPGQFIQVSSRHIFDPEMFPNEQSILNRMLWVFKQAEEHEMLEFFQYKGKAPFDPHAHG